MMIKRGDIYRVNLEPTRRSEQQGNARPCVVLSVGAFNNKLPTIGVVPLSTAARSLPPLIIPVPSAGRDTSIAVCNQLRTVDKSRITGGLVAQMSAADLQKVEHGVKQYYSL